LNYKNAQTAAERTKTQQALSDLSDYGGYSESNVDVVGILGGLSKSMTAEEAYEAAGITRTGSQEFFGECAAFTNDMLGESSKYGSSYESKYRNRNSDVPSMGSVFISTLGANGHCGFVEDIDYENGTATLYDMNRYGKNMANRRTVPLDTLATTEGITAYENIALSAKENVGEKTQVELWEQDAIGLGITNSKDIKEFVDTKIKDASGDLNEVQAKKFTAYVGMKPENDLYNEITEELDQVEFANALNALSRAAEKAGEQGLLSDWSDDFVRGFSSDETVQRALLSEKRWIEAKLREESSAAISVGEYLGNGNQFFPRPNNTEQVFKDKKAARERVTESKFGAAGTAGQISATKLLKKQEARKVETREQKLKRREREAQENVSEEEADELEGL